MKSAAHRIVQTLDRHLQKPTEMIVFGSAAAILDERFDTVRDMDRMTNDVDLILPTDKDVEITSDGQFWDAIEAANREMEPDGLYITHCMPECEVVLSSGWQERLVSLNVPGLKQLSIKRPSVLDLILTKMGRGDEKDLRFVQAMLHVEPLPSRQIIEATKAAHVPEVYAEVFPGARDRVIAEVVRMENRRAQVMDGVRPSLDISLSDPPKKQSARER